MALYRSGVNRLCFNRQIVQRRKVTSDVKTELPSVRLGKRGLLLWVSVVNGT